VFFPQRSLSRSVKFDFFFSVLSLELFRVLLSSILNLFYCVGARGLSRSFDVGKPTQSHVNCEINSHRGEKLTRKVKARERERKGERERER